MKVIWILSIFLCVPEIFAKRFRCDYSYSDKASGWLKINNIPANWHEARLRCYLEGAQLASPWDRDLSDAILKHIQQETDIKWAVYTGIHATFSKGDYFNIEGTPLRYMPVKWATNEPDNFNDHESCVVMMHDGTLADVNCNDTFPYICFRPELGQDLVINECGTIDDRYKRDPRTGNCYKFHNVPRTWSRAFMTCAAEGGYLVIIDNDLEAQIVTELFAENPGHTMVGNFWKDVAFVGFHDWGEHGDWVTNDGRPLAKAYHKFAPGEPNNATTGEFCGAVYRNGMLDDLWCENKYAFICEKEWDSLSCFWLNS